MTSVPLLAFFFCTIFALANFFFALAETAMFSLSRSNIRRMAASNDAAGKKVATLLKDPEDLLASVSLANTFTGASMLTIALVMAWEGQWPLLQTIAAIFLISLLVCEVIPKTLASRDPEYWSLRTAPTLGILVKVSAPLRDIALRVTERSLTKLVPKRWQPEKGLTDEEYEDLINLAYKSGTLDETERDTIIELIQLDHRNVKEVATHRSQMMSVSDDMSDEEIRKAARESKHRRLPVYHEVEDNIVGIIDARRLLLHPEQSSDLAIDALPYKVPETADLMQTLNTLQGSRRGMAIVIDEYGGTEGVITVEDILEEIVGNISNEGEVEESEITHKGKNQWRVMGTMKLHELEDVCPEISEAPEVETIGGLVLSLSEIVPEPGFTAQYNGVQLTALTVDTSRVIEVLVQRKGARKPKAKAK